MHEKTTPKQSLRPTPINRHNDGENTGSAAIPPLVQTMSPSAILRLQSTIGNQAVQRTLLRRAPHTTVPSAPTITPQSDGNALSRSWYDSVLEAVGLSSPEETTEDETEDVIHLEDGDWEEISDEEADETETEEDTLGESEPEEEEGGIIDSILEWAGFGDGEQADEDTEPENLIETIGGLISSIGGAISGAIEGVEGMFTRWTSFDAAKISRQTVPGVLTSFQANRIEPAVTALGDDDYSRLRVLLTNANSEMEFAFICKALTAGHNLDEVEEFADTINGLSERWMQENLNATAEVDTDGSGRGIQQQFGNSCGPTSVQLIHAQADPIYALSLHSAGAIDEAVDDAKTNPDNAPNDVLADEQNTMLQDHADAGTGNAATDRSNPTGGAWVESNMNALSAATGVTYTNQIVGTGILLADAIETLKTSLEQGIHVPIVVGGSVGDTAHYVVAMLISGENVQIHDVWTGDTIWRSLDNFRNSTLNLPSGHTMLTAIDVPSAVAPTTP